jgi:hypothetical protein
MVYPLHPNDIHKLMCAACDVAHKLHQGAHQVQHALRASAEGGSPTQLPETHKATPVSPQRVG